MDIEFWKMSGAGNDFVVMNNMDGRISPEGREPLFADWCRRGMSIGADGVLVVEPAIAPENHFRMRYHNADGGEAETCGNGSRCIARFAYLQGVAPAAMKFETIAGVYEARVEGDFVTVSLSDAHGARDPIAIADGVFRGEVAFANTGVPHAVIFCDDLAATDVFAVGRHLRHHPEFAPAGANANFIRVTGRHSFDIRTYERGVEAETLACGTGSTAAAIMAARRGLVESPVEVTTASGEILRIAFSPTDDGATNVTLNGGARVVFRGHIDCPLVRPPQTTK